MNTHGSLPSRSLRHGLTALLLAVATTTAAFAGARSSANYGVTADTTDAGGLRATSAAYTNTGSLGNVAGSATSAAYAVGSGYIAQLSDAGPVITSSLTASGTYNTAISTYTITATNSPTSFSATGLPGGLSINTSTGAITGTPTAAGVFNVTLGATNASGTGNATLVFTIAKAAQTISFTGPANRAYSTSPITLSATASSGLTVSFSIVSGPGSISLGATLLLSGPGTVVIRASQAGNTNYLAATNVDRSMVVYPVGGVAGDMNGDGMADILWENTTTGDRGFWLMNGTGFSSWVDIGIISPNLRIAGTADFNGDGKMDIIWENTVTGKRVIWFMNGTTFISSFNLGIVSTDWRIAAVGDFNGDGKADILWENTVNGDRGFWIMNGTTFTAWVDIGVVGTDWRIAGAGDFNGDGQLDILWENTTTGDRGVWLMSGTGFTAWADIGIVPTDWRIAGVGDFNGDGKADLLWENTVSGFRYIWLMNGTTVASAIAVGTITTDWRIAN